MKKLTVIIPTLNEEPNLQYCLRSLQLLDADILVIDSGSNDKTLEIARSFGAKVFYHAFENHAKQYNWVLDNIPINTPWCMRMDADEKLSRELCLELCKVLEEVGDDIVAMLIKRRVYFWGKWIRFGGYYPMWLLRIWRLNKARCEDRWMDEHMAVETGKVIKLRSDIIDENLKGLGFWIEKHNRYADREVLDLMTPRSTHEVGGLVGQAGSRRWLKTNVYLRFPIFVRVFLYWFYRYFILLGFLDGIPGLVFHLLQAFWYRFLVDAKLYEAGRKNF